MPFHFLFLIFDSFGLKFTVKPTKSVQMLKLKAFNNYEIVHNFISTGKEKSIITDHRFCINCIIILVTTEQFRMLVNIK